MNVHPPGNRLGLVVAYVAFAAAARCQEKQAAAPVPPLATSSQGQAKAPVDIVLDLRHSPPGDGRCDQGADACKVTEHWLVELQAAGSKPVRLALDQQAELQKELKSGGRSKERKVEGVTLTDASLSLRVPPNTPYARVQALLLAAAQAGIHRTEFAVASLDKKTEQRLAVPLPVSTASVPKDGDADAAAEEIRVSLSWDQAKEVVTRTLGGPSRLRGVRIALSGRDDQLRSLIKSFADGKPQTPGCIDAASDVPWSAVVQTIDAFRAVGIQAIQFASLTAGK